MIYNWDMMTSMETFSALRAICAGNSPIPVNSPHKGQWRRPLMFSLIYAWINDWVNNREAGDLRRHRGHHDVIVWCYVLSEIGVIRVTLHERLRVYSHRHLDCFFNSFFRLTSKKTSNSSWPFVRFAKCKDKSTLQFLFKLQSKITILFK